MAPTRKVEYSATGAAWTDVSDDVRQCSVKFRELVAGTSDFSVTLNNSKGKYVPTIFTTWPEAGLGYYWRFTFDGVIVMTGKDLSLEIPQLNPEELTITGSDLGEALANVFLTGVIPRNTIDTMIKAGIAENPATGAVFLLTTTGSPPNYGTDYDTRKNRVFLHDFIRELVESVNDTNFLGWCAFVDTTLGINVGNIRLFQQNSKLLTTSLISVPGSLTNNVNDISYARRLQDVKNDVLFVGGLSTSEPPDGDSWTEGQLLGWSSSGSPPKTAISIDDLRYHCLSRDSGGNCLSGTHSIRGYAPSNPYFGLDLSNANVLGDVFDTEERSATALSFYLRAMGTNLPIPLIINTELWDSTGRTINFTSDIMPTGSGVQDNFTSITRRVGKSATKGVLGASNSDWYVVNDSSNDFNWKIMSIRFNDITPGTLEGAGWTPTIWVDHLHFAQNYQPQYHAVNNDSIAKYGLRKDVYDGSQYLTKQGLTAFGTQKIAKLSNPSLTLTVKTTKSAADENFFPGYSFQAANMFSRYGANGYNWRVLEVDYDWQAAGYIITFQLTPSTGPVTSGTGVGVDYSLFDSRKVW